MTTNGSPATRSDGGTALLSLFAAGSQQIAALLMTLLAAGILGAADYGVYALALVFVEAVVMLTYTGFYHFIVTSEDDTGVVLSTMFVVLLAIGSLGGAVMALSADWLAAVFHAPDLAPTLRILAILQPVASVVGWGSAALTRAGHMRPYFRAIATSNIVALSVGTLAMIAWQTVAALILFRAVRVLLAAALLFVAAPQKPGLTIDTGMIRRAARYAQGLYSARVLGFAANFGTDLALALLFSTAESGLYRFAHRLTMASVDLVAQPLRTFALRAFGDTARRGIAPGGIFSDFLASGLLLTGLVSATVFVLAPLAVGTLFHPDYAAAVPVVRALCLLAIARVVQQMIEPVFATRATTTGAFRGTLTVAVAMICAIAVAAPSGITPLAWSLAAAQFLTVPALLALIRRRGGIPLRPAVGQALKALVLVAGFTVALSTTLMIFPFFALPSTVLLALGVMAATGLGAITLAAGLRSGALPATLFSGATPRDTSDPEAASGPRPMRPM